MEAILVQEQKKTYRNSTQRNQVLAYLQKNRTHPNVQAIYRDLKPLIPSLSLGNLYRNLGILAEQKLVLQLRTPGSDEIRYDGCVAEHCHFSCTVCGGLFDLDLPGCLDRDGQAKAWPGFQVEALAVHLQGRCPDCAAGGPVSSSRTD